MKPLEFEGRYRSVPPRAIKLSDHAPNAVRIFTSAGTRTFERAPSRRRASEKNGSRRLRKTAFVSAVTVSGPVRVRQRERAVSPQRFRSFRLRAIVRTRCPNNPFFRPRPRPRVLVPLPTSNNPFGNGIAYRNRATPARPDFDNRPSRKPSVVVE